MQTKNMRSKTPRELGYFMPAEWERHEAIWLSWPYDPTTFQNVGRAEETYAEIISAIHESEKVNLLVVNSEMKARAVKLLEKMLVGLGKIRFIFHDYADVWFRDYGPTFIVDKAKRKLAMVHWVYNAYGRKYEELARDVNIPDVINQEMKLPCFKPGIVMEGGSIDVNGCGALLTTEQCLLNRNRNPQLSRAEIEEYLKNNLGVRHIIWLKEGIVGDDTDGHVDDIARFVNSTTVLCAFEENAKDENHAVLKENYEILLKSKDQDGNKLNVIKLPMPGPVMADETRLPASYANFYIGNKAVLVPVFGHKNDKIALEIIQKAFPERKVVGINCTDLVYGLGTIHCISQQQPAIE